MRAEAVLVLENLGQESAQIEARLQAPQRENGATETLTLEPGRGGSIRLVVQGALEGQSGEVELVLTLRSTQETRFSGTLYYDATAE